MQACVGANPAIQLRHQSNTAPGVGAQHPNAVLTCGGPASIARFANSAENRED